MSICNFVDTYGAPPTTCPERQEYMLTFFHALQSLDTFKVGSGDAVPTWNDLISLWSPCEAPTPALVVWENTTTGVFSQWVRRPDDSWLQLTST